MMGRKGDSQESTGIALFPFLPILPSSCVSEENMINPQKLAGFIDNKRVQFGAVALMLVSTAGAVAHATYHQKQIDVEDAQLQGRYEMKMGTIVALERSFDAELQKIADEVLGRAGITLGDEQGAPYSVEWGEGFRRLAARGGEAVRTLDGTPIVLSFQHKWDHFLKITSLPEGRDLSQFVKVSGSLQVLVPGRPNSFFEKAERTNLPEPIAELDARLTATLQQQAALRARLEAALPKVAMK
jgi:hypothetical protein